jgi:transposase
MAKPYSLDLRIRVIENLAEGNITQLAVAAIFKVSLRTVKRWVKLHNKTGSIDPKVPISTKPRKVDYKEAKKFIEENPDKTLKEIGERFKVTDKAVWYIVRKLGITYKKTLLVRGKAGRFERRISKAVESDSKRKSDLS